MRRAAVIGLVLLAGCGEADRAVAPRPAVDPALTRPGQGELPLGQPARVRAPLPAGETGVLALDGRAVVRPRTLAIAEDAELERLRWSAWGGPTAHARGRLGVLQCSPDCASAGVAVVAATVRLSDPVDCPDGRFYDRAIVTVDGRARRRPPAAGEVRELSQPASFIQAPC